MIKSWSKTNHKRTIASECHVSEVRKLFYILFIILQFGTVVTAKNNTATVRSGTAISTKSMSGTTSDSRAHDCTLVARNVATGLGSVVLMETLFCCFVLYRWIQKQRLKQRKTIAATSQNVNRTSKQEQHYNAESRAGPSSIHEAPSPKRKNVLNRIRCYLFKRNSPSQSSHYMNGHALDVEAGDDIYSEAYDDQVTATHSFSKAANQEARNCKPTIDACYHMLGEPSCPLTQEAQDSLYYCKKDCVEKADQRAESKDAQTSEVCYHVLEEPESPSPQEAQDSLYYSSEDCVDKPTKGTLVRSENEAFYHVLEDGECSPQEAQQHGSLYYSSEDCVDKMTQSTPKGIAKPKPVALKQMSQEVKKQALKSKTPLPYHPNNQPKLKSKIKTSNKIVGKPLKTKPGLKANVIQEMKIRAAQKNTGN